MKLIVSVFYQMILIKKHEEKSAGKEFIFREILSTLDVLLTQILNKIKKSTINNLQYLNSLAFI